MAYDGLIMAGITAELRSFKDARIERVYQPEGATIILQMHHASRRKLRLLLSAEPSTPRVHLTEVKMDNPLTPPVFCMLLRKFLEGSRLIDVTQHGLERILTLHLLGHDELGNSVTYQLIAEVMGRHSNIALVSPEGKIIDAIHRIPPAVSTVRMMLPGIRYEYPSHQERVDTLDIDGLDQLEHALQKKVGQQLSKAIVGNLTGFSPLLAEELLFRAGLPAGVSVQELKANDWYALLAEVRNLQTVVRSSQFAPSVSATRYAAIMLTHIQAIPWEGSVNEMVDQLFTREMASKAFEKFRRNLLQVVRQSLEKESRKLSSQTADQLAMTENLTLRRFGELILANAHLIPPKAKDAKVVDYYDPQLREVSIELDPQFSPTQNAQRHFRRYEKARKGLEIAEINIEKTRSKVAYLETLVDSLERADSREILDEVKQEILDAGLLQRDQGNRRQKSSTVNSQPARYMSADGYEILVGRNNLQNERLTRSAQGDDWWLHTKDIPGSHVIIKGCLGDIPDDTLLMAAQLAAWYSKARQSSKVPVDYTRRRYVKKPGGSPPGFVIYTDQRTILVEPQEFEQSIDE